VLQTKTKEIELFGEKYLLSERTAFDVMSVTELFPGGKMTNSEAASLFAYVVSQALKINLNNLKWYQVFKKRKINKIISTKYLLKNLSVSQIDELWKQVMELEGVDLKKKIAEAESDLTAQ
jgi:hypothetical protein